MVALSRSLLWRVAIWSAFRCYRSIADEVGGAQAVSASGSLSRLLWGVPASLHTVSPKRPREVHRCQGEGA